MSGMHERALRRDLKRVAAADRSGALAQLGLTIARVLDAAAGESPVVLMSARDFTAVSAQFHAVLGSIAKLQLPPAVADPVDELAAARARRRGAAG